MKKRIAWVILGLFAVVYVGFILWAIYTRPWSAFIFGGAILIVWAGRTALYEP